MGEKGIIADVAPVRHGRWIHERTEGGFHIWRCNQCGSGMNNNPNGTYLYCYHCGAKMDEKNIPKGIIGAVPVSELEELRDYLYAEDLIFMRGLAKLNKLIANYCAEGERKG